MKRVVDYLNLKDELEKLEQRSFYLTMKDTWDSEDYKISYGIDDRIKKIKELFKMTPSEKKILIVIDKFIKENGYAPTIREICNETGYKSTATVFEKVRVLKLKGYITYIDGKNRTIKILKKGDE